MPPMGILDCTVNANTYSVVLTTYCEFYCVIVIGSIFPNVKAGVASNGVGDLNINSLRVVLWIITKSS